MTIQMAFEPEISLAMDTLVWEISGVYSLVFNKDGRRREMGHAKAAREWLLASVRSHVLD